MAYSFVGRAGEVQSSIEGSLNGGIEAGVADPGGLGDGELPAGFGGRNMQHEVAVLLAISLASVGADGGVEGGVVPGEGDIGGVGSDSGDGARRAWAAIAAVRDLVDRDGGRAGPHIRRGVDEDLGGCG